MGRTKTIAGISSALSAGLSDAVGQKCRIELFGGPQIWYGTRSAHRFRTQKTASLFAYLAFHADRLHSRDTLRAMFWGDSTPDAGSSNLSVAQSSIRSLVAEGLGMDLDILRAERQRLGINPCLVDVDTTRFENLLDKAEGLPDEDAFSLLRSATLLYKGPLLPDMYDEWVSRQQLRLADRFFQASHRLAGIYRSTGDHKASLQALQRVVDFDPAHVDAAEALIRLQLEDELFGQAARTFHELQQAITARSGEEDASVREAAVARMGNLYPMIEPHLNSYQRRAATNVGFRKRTRKPGKTDERLLTSATSPSRGGVELMLPAARTLPASMATPIARGLPPGLPLPLTRFFGREDEMLRLGWLLGDPSARLVTLTGPGGGGKTRLALAVAEERQRRRGGGSENGDFWNLEPSPFPELCGGSEEDEPPSSDNDVIFLSFNDADAACRLPELLADALGTRLPLPDEAGLNQDAPWTRNALDMLTVALAARPGLLLILDNFDCLASTEASPFLERLLTQATQLKVLTTSRSRLPIDGERSFTVGSLPIPSYAGLPDLEQMSPDTLLAEWPGIALFVDRARLANPSFTLTRRNAATVVQIVSRLDGLPLAIELAAACCRTLEPHRILKGLEHRFDLLVTARHGTPDRQHSLRECMLFSYRLLSPALQAFFCRLSVLRGGFTLDAASAVGDDPLAHSHLAQLADASLVQVQSNGDEVRFDLLESVREFAMEQFSLASTSEVEAARLRHARFCVGFAEEASSQLSGTEQSQWLSRLDDNAPNLRAALIFCLDADRHDAARRELALRLGVALTPFWHWRGRQAEGTRSLRAILEAHGEFPDSKNLPLCSEAQCRRLAQLWNGLGVLKMSRQEWDGARSAYQRGLLLWQEIGDARGLAASRNNRAMLEQQTGDLETAQAEYEASLLYWREVGDQKNVARVLNNLSTVAIQLGQHKVAQVTLSESLALTRQTGDALGFASRLHNLGELALECGKAEQADTYYQSSLQHARASGNWPLCARNVAGLSALRLDRAPRDNEGRQWLSAALDYLRAAGHLVSPLLRARLSRLGFDYLLYAGASLAVTHSEDLLDDGFPAVGELTMSPFPAMGTPEDAELSAEAARTVLARVVDELLTPSVRAPASTTNFVRW